MIIDTICPFQFCSPDLIRNVSNAIAIEMRARWNQNKQQKKANSTQGLACFGPTANLMRHPLWGKNKVRIHIIFSKALHNA